MTNYEHALGSVAEQYRSQGYQVVLFPTREQRPEFAAEHPIDLLAFGDQENVIVEVRQSREELSGDEQLARLAEIVGAHPSWRLDLVVLNREAPGDRVRPDALEPTNAQLEETLAMAELLLRGGQLPPALLLAWAALEAVLRRTLRGTGAPLQSYSASYLLSALSADGPLEQDDYDRLSRALVLRNHVAHGLDLAQIPSDTIRDVLRIAERLLPLPTLGRAAS